jgi:hypothetical protein
MSGCVLGLLAGISVPSTGQAAPLEQRTGRDECFAGKPGGVPGCASLVSKLETVQAGNKRLVRLQCPGTTPNFWNWSAYVTPGVHVTLQEVIQGKNGRDLGAVLWVHEQTGAGPGSTRIVLGCSNKIAHTRARLLHHGSHPAQPS